MTNIIILEHIYACTNKAASMLENYIHKIQKTFQHEPEIIRDIELGIIEQLDLMLSDRASKQLTLVDVEFLIQKMGDVELQDNQATPADPVLGGQNLYRDYDNRIIAGVCAGIAAYFNLSAWVVRSIFILCFFTPIPVIIPYLLMWFLIPPALTKSEKLNMKGIPVSINAIVNNNQYVRNKIIHLTKLLAIICAAVIFIIVSYMFIWTVF